MDDHKLSLLCQSIDWMDIQLSKQIPWSSRKKDRQKETVCDVCNEPLLKSIQYPIYLPNGVTPGCCATMWNQKVCPSHLLDGTLMCCSCMRLETRINDSYINLSDGRVICSDCYSTAVLEARQCEPLIRKVNEFFKTMNLEIREEIRVFLVDTSEMTRLVGEEDYNLGEPVFGLRLTEGDEVTSSVITCSRRGDDIVPTQRRERRCGGLRIAVLFGLPWVMTGAILAHEVMHVWFEFEGIGGEQLEGKVSEGMCQVMGFKWLEWFEFNHGELIASSSSNEAQFQRNLIETYKFVTKMHGSYEYGEGFRDAQWAVEKFGLHKTLDHISATKKLP